MANRAMVRTPRCMMCGKDGDVVAPLAEVRRWEQGELIQHAMPSLTADQREQLINGTHPECWDALMGEEEWE